MRLAYIISAYTRLPQVARLVRRLDGDGTTLLVHVDSKTDDGDYAALVDSLTDVTSVGWLARHPCHWGGFGHVRATLKGIHELERRAVPFDYLILLTGQDYPIKPVSEIAGFLEAAEGRSFMAHSALPSDSWSPRGGLNRVEHWHLRLYGHHVRAPFKRRFPTGLSPYGGGAYWCLSRECVDYVREFIRTRPEVVSFFEHVDIPDESFFQTILLNSELHDTIVNDTLRYIDWTRGRRPAILESADFEALRASPKLFARKFDMTRHPEVLDLIDRHLLTPGALAGESAPTTHGIT
jgi:hypothetical protein